MTTHKIESNIPVPKSRLGEIMQILETLAKADIGQSISIEDTGTINELSVYAKRFNIRVTQKKHNGKRRIWRIG